MTHYQFRRALYHELGHIQYYNLDWKDKIKALNNVWNKDKCHAQLSTYNVMEVIADNFAIEQGYDSSYMLCS